MIMPYGAARAPMTALPVVEAIIMLDAVIATLDSRLFETRKDWVRAQL